MKIGVRPPQQAADASGAGTAADQTALGSQSNGFADHLAKFETAVEAAKQDIGGTAVSTDESDGPSTLAGSGKASDLLSLLSSAATANSAKQNRLAKPADASVGGQSGTLVSIVLPAAVLAQAGVMILPKAAASASSTTPKVGSPTSADGADSLAALQSLAQTLNQKAGLKDRDDASDAELTAPIGVSHVAFASQIAPPSGPREGVGIIANAASSPSSGQSKSSQTSVSPDVLGAQASTVASVKPGKAEIADLRATPQQGASSATLPFIPDAFSSTAAGLALEAAEPASTLAGAETSPPAATSVAQGSARTMTLELSPSELGTINVRMHVTGSTLDMKLSVAEPQTLGLLSRDHDSLANALRNQQYNLNSLVVQNLAIDPTSSGDQNAQSRSSANQNGAPTDGQARPDGGSNAQDQSSGRDQQHSGSASAERALEFGSDTLFV